VSLTPTMPKSMDEISVERIQAAIRDIPDFPKPGILFKDITPVLADARLFQEVTDYFYHQLKDRGIQYVVGIESRGFVLGAPLAYRLGVGFVPIRKMGKLPGVVERHEYDLEYGSDCVEIHQDAIPAGAKVVLVDDLLATGGTAGASVTLLRKLNAEVDSVIFMIELAFLNGREKLQGIPNLHAMIQY
jgi:adenine phosphoribosyltransferase